MIDNNLQNTWNIKNEKDVGIPLLMILGIRPLFAQPTHKDWFDSDHTINS